MKHFIQSNLLKLIDYALYIGLGLGIICLLLSYGLNTDSRMGSLLINLSGDFIMVGLTISVVDNLIKRSERQKFGDVPDVAKKAINDEIWQLIGVLSFTVRDALSKSTQEIIDSGIVDEAYQKDVDMLKRMEILELAQLKVIDDTKLTHGMFSEMLRFIRQTQEDLDGLITRYSIVFESQDIAKALSLRDSIEGLGRRYQLTTITMSFSGQHSPDKPLDTRQRTAFMAIKDDIIGLTEKLLV